MFIYVITNLINGKQYVGQTCESLSKRFKRHMGYQKDAKNTKFYRAVNKYGSNNFKIELLDTALSQEELDDKEIFWINELDTYHNGYNSKISKGKCGGDTLSNHPNKKEILKKLSESKKGAKNPMRIYGGLKGERNEMYGKKGIKNPKSYKVLVINIISGFVDICYGYQEICIKYNIPSVSIISNRVNNKINKPYKDLTFILLSPTTIEKHYLNNEPSRVGVVSKTT